MGEENKRDNTPIIVAIISLVGVLSAAIIANVDKIGALIRSTAQPPVAAEESPAASRGPQEVTPTPKSGVAEVTTKRFANSDCGVIKDTRTGLEWYIGPDENTSWIAANNWIESASFCNRNGWMLPTAAQVAAITDRSSRAGTGYVRDGARFYAHLNRVFDDIGGGAWVWVAGKSEGAVAPAFNLNQVKPVSIDPQTQEFAVRVLAVRQP